MAKKKSVATRVGRAVTKYDRRSSSRPMSKAKRKTQSAARSTHNGVAKNQQPAAKPIAVAAPAGRPPLSAEVRAKHKEFLFPCVANYYEEPVVLTKGKGSWAW